MTTLDQVKEFHKAFNRPINDKPNIHDDAANELRIRLLREEVLELEDALAFRSEEQVFDALLDIQYILDGCFLQLGFWRAKEHGFEIVHRANMRKLGPDGKPRIRDDGKILKPHGWQAPDLKGALSLL